MRVLFKYLLLVILIQSCGHHQAYTNKSVGNQSKEYNQGNSIFVSPKGIDSNSGAISAPLKTLKAAIKLAKPNTTIYLREGIYSEKVIISSSKSPLIIQAYENEIPVISGVDTIQNWKLYRKNIYYTKVNKEVTQLFLDSKQMQIARWPNLVTDNLFEQQYATASQVNYIDKDNNSNLIDTALVTLKDVDIIGARIWLPYPLKTKWNSFTEVVKKQTATNLEFSSANKFDNEASVDYFLVGKLELLDTEKEWFYDARTNRLYFYAPKGVNPSTLKVLARTRLDGIVVNGSNLQIKGIDFFASRVVVKGNNNLIESCNFKYPRPFYHTKKWKEEAGVSITGKFNTIKKCEVAYSWGSGISMRKSEDGLVENCLVHDCNWSGSIAPGIWIDGTRMTARSNTIYSCGRSGIRLYRVYNSLFEKNHVYDYGKINHDLGAIKGGLQDYKNSTWRYNYTHSAVTNNSKAGIYLDASNDNATVHHNVMYNVHLSINGEVNNDSIYNNTLVANNKKQKIWSHYIRKGHDWDYRSVSTLNNLSTREVKGTELKHNLKISDINEMGFVGYEYGDFRLRPNSPAINYGLSINTIAAYYNQPDAGAFEFNATSEFGNWMPGITWSPKWNKLPTSEIEINIKTNNPNVVDISVINDIDIDGWIMRYDWDFGDETTSYGKTVQHHYKKRGTYKVVLTLRDNLGGITMIEKQIKIKI